MSQPQLAVELIHEVAAQGFRFSVVIPDSRYGEISGFTRTLHGLCRFHSYSPQTGL